MVRTFLALTASVALLAPLACGNGGSGGGNTAGGGGSGGNVTDCSQRSTNACFTNVDCTDSSNRCEVVGMKDDGAGSTEPVACCVPGDRGTGMVGDACMHETDCASGLCEQDVDGNLVCSKECTADSDCPMSLPSCASISDTGFKGSFCAPPP